MGREVRAQAPRVPTHSSASDSRRSLDLSDVPGPWLSGSVTCEPLWSPLCGHLNDLWNVTSRLACAALPLQGTYFHLPSVQSRLE